MGQDAVRFAMHLADEETNVVDPFSRRRLGRTDLHLTVLGLGCASVGSMYGFVNEEEGTATIRETYEIGVRYFDVAPLYGHGSAERRVGEGLRDAPRDSFVLSSKVGRLLVPDESGGGRIRHFHDREPYRAVFDFSRDGVLRSIEESLERLQMDAIDILFIHDPQSAIGDALDHAYPALDQLRSEGVVKAIGAGIDFSEVCRMLALFADFDCFLLASRYTLLEQAPLVEFLPLCERRNIGVVVGGIFNTGILATGAVEGAYYDHRPAPPEIVQRVQALERICDAFNVPIAAAALQFPLAHPAVTSVIPGARSAKRIAANANLMRTPIPESFWSALKHEGLLLEQAPTPSETPVSL
jgi:D-threo-aldose 1-dehydrogenase